MHQRNILLFELNEVPWRVIDYLVGHRPGSSIARLLRKSKTLTTVLEDTYNIEPWRAWPGLHRGVPDHVHGVRHLGQDLAASNRDYPPIWRILADAGIPVGVFGSLHAGLPPQGDPACRFHFPDSWETIAEVLPARLEPVQAFSLAMARESGRNVASGIPQGVARNFAATWLKEGGSFGTMAAIMQQLLRERVDSTYRNRRRYLQSPILFDVFARLMASTRPRFATFHAKNVAAAMHQFWDATFPDPTLAEAFPPEWRERFGGEILFSMDIADRMIARAKRFVDEHENTVLVIASGLGQETTRSHPTRNFVTITDPERFLIRLGLAPGDWTPRHAMLPNVSAKVRSDKAERFEQALLQLKLAGQPMVANRGEAPPLSYDRCPDNSFHVTVFLPNRTDVTEVQIGNESVPFPEIGLSSLALDELGNDSGRHTPLGSLIIYDPQRACAADLRTKISVLDLAPAILANFGVPCPSYMRQADTSLFDVSVTSPSFPFDTQAEGSERLLARVE